MIWLPQVPNPGEIFWTGFSEAYFLNHSSRFVIKKEDKVAGRHVIHSGKKTAVPWLRSLSLKILDKNLGACL